MYQKERALLKDENTHRQENSINIETVYPPQTIPEVTLLMSLYSSRILRIELSGYF
jgi:hypothetical protein